MVMVAVIKSIGFMLCSFGLVNSSLQVVVVVVVYDIVISLRRKHGS